MRRRDLIAAGTVVALSAPVLTSSSALASSEKKAEDEPAVAPAVNFSPIGLPVIVDGRIRNYVFVTISGAHVASLAAAGSDIHVNPDPAGTLVLPREFFSA